MKRVSASAGKKVLHVVLTSTDVMSSSGVLSFPAEAGGLVPPRQASGS